MASKLDTVTLQEPGSPVVVVEGLSKTFNDGKVKAVDGVTFQIREGEVFGFLGPNGAGKTTTIKMITTLIKPTAGRAQVFAYDVGKHAPEVRRIIGIVPQEYTADEDMTGKENILLCADLYGIPRSISKERADELLRLVELHNDANRKVSTYSGGMRRRLELACGLINHPRLLFLDEPTLGLDVQTRAAVWKYIRKLKEEYSMTLFMTTHYLEEADGLCDRIAIIDHGKIITIGTPNELKAAVGGDVIELGVKETDNDFSDLIAHVVHVKEVKKTGTGYRIKAERGEEAAPAIIDAIRSAGCHVNRISLTKPTMDEAYLEFTGRSLREEEMDRGAMWTQRRTMRMARSR